MSEEVMEKSAAMAEIESEINTLLEQESSAEKTTDDAPETKDLPAEEVDDDSSESDDPPASSEDKDTDEGVDDSAGIPDDLIERAIKLGVPYKDAKAFSSVDSLERVLSLLDKDAGVEEKSAGDVDEGSDDELLAHFPELDPDEYDEKIIAGFEFMKNAITKLANENKTLVQKLESGAASDFLSGKIAAAGEDALAQSDVIRRKFSILEAGYKASGEKVSRDEIFSDALALVVGDASASESRKKDAVAKRESQRLSRASGVSRKEKTDTEEEVIAAIDRKFFAKK
jgi:hypothetical protein